MRHRLFGVSAAILSCVSLGACGTLMNPYVVPTQNAAETGWTKKLPYGENVTLTGARGYAGAFAETYRSAAADHAMAKNVLGVGIIALNTAGLIKSSISPADGSDLLPVIGFGSAGALNAGGLLISSPRQGVYLMGRQAMLCARSRTDAYVVSNPVLDRLLDDSAGFSVQHEQLRGLVAAAKADVRRQPTRSRDNPETPGTVAWRQADARAEAAFKAARQQLAAEQVWLSPIIAEAEALIDQGAPVRQDLESYQVRRGSAALRLVADVNLISATTDREVQKTEPSVSDIRAAVTKSASASTLELPAPPAKKTPEGAAQGLAGDGPPPPGAQRHQALVNAVAQMRQILPVAVVARDRALAAEQAAVASNECLAAGVARVEPIAAPAQSLIAGQGDLLIPVQITAGVGSPAPTPRAEVVGSPAGFTVQVIVVDAPKGSYQVRLQAAASVPPGPYVLSVTADGVRTVQFTVEAAENETADASQQQQQQQQDQGPGPDPSTNRNPGAAKSPTGR